jgi:Zn-dependent M28 family amino/carboxypeptidase
MPQQRPQPGFARRSRTRKVPRRSRPGSRSGSAWTFKREERQTANVIGILPGKDPARARDALVLGAHYDHLGRTDGHVHLGADDNASGTALVLGLAKALAATGGMPGTLVFVLFSGEEIGLLGSTHHTRHPVIPVEQTVAMLNFDMVGRMRDGKVNVAGVESGTGLRGLLTDAAAGGPLTLVLHDTPYAPSDQTPFYSAGTPSCSSSRASTTRQCKACDRQTSVTAGTVLHRTRVPLTVWFWATYLATTHRGCRRRNCSANSG